MPNQKKVSPEVWVASSAFVIGMIALPLVFRGCCSGACDKKKCATNNAEVYINGSNNTVNINQGDSNVIVTPKPVVSTKKPEPKPEVQPQPKTQPKTQPKPQPKSQPKPKPAQTNQTVPAKQTACMEYTQVFIDCHNHKMTREVKAYYSSVGNDIKLDSLVDFTRPFKPEDMSTGAAIDSLNYTARHMYSGQKSR